MQKNHSAFIYDYASLQKNILHNPNIYSLFFCLPYKLAKLFFCA